MIYLYEGEFGPYIANCLLSGDELIDESKEDLVSIKAFIKRNSKNYILEWLKKECVYYSQDYKTEIELENYLKIVKEKPDIEDLAEFLKKFLKPKKYFANEDNYQLCYDNKTKRIYAMKSKYETMDIYFKKIDQKILKFLNKHKIKIQEIKRALRELYWL